MRIRNVLSNAKIMAGAVAVSFAAGWAVKGWQSDSVAYAAKLAADKVISSAQARESEIAKAVERTIKENAVKERTIVREMQPIISREVYKQDCIDDDGLSIINGLLPD